MEKLYETFTVEQDVLDKWMPLLEGSGKWESFVSTCPKLGRMDFATVAQLLENTELLKERTTAGNGTGDFSPILIPMLRRVMPSLIGMQIFGTQPMSGPTGLIFALRAAFQNDSTNPMLADGTTPFTTSVMLTVAALTDGNNDTAAVDGDISMSVDDTQADPVETGVGKIVAIEGNNLLVRVVSGSFATSTSASVNVVCYAATVAQNDGVQQVSYPNEALHNMIFPEYT